MSKRHKVRCFGSVRCWPLHSLLGACTKGGQFDPTTLLDNDMFDSKKPLKGEREPVFPNGVPGVQSGIPPDLYKGYQPPPEQAADNGNAARSRGQLHPPSRPNRQSPNRSPSPRLRPRRRRRRGRKSASGLPSLSRPSNSNRRNVDNRRGLRGRKRLGRLHSRRLPRRPRVRNRRGPRPRPAVRRSKRPSRPSRSGRNPPPTSSH